MADQDQHSVETKRGCVLTVLNASPDGFVSDRMRLGEPIMFIDNEKLVPFRPSEDPLTKAILLARTLDEARLPLEKIDVVLSCLSLNEEFNRAVLNGVSERWLNCHLKIEQEKRWRKSFLLKLEAAWSDPSSVRSLLEEARKFGSGELAHDTRLLSDTALLVILKARFPNESVRQSLPKLTAIFELHPA